MGNAHQGHRCGGRRWRRDLSSKQGVFGPPFLIPLVAGTAVLAYAYAIDRFGLFDVMESAGIDRRLGFYALLATAGTLLIAVISTGLGIYLSSSNPSIVDLRERAGQMGRRVWSRALLALLLLGAVCAAAYLGEPAINQPDRLWPRMLVAWALVVVLARVGYAVAFYIGQVHRTVEGWNQDQLTEHPRVVDLLPKPRRGAG